MATANAFYFPFLGEERGFVITSILRGFLCRGVRMPLGLEYRKEALGGISEKENRRERDYSMIILQKDPAPKSCIPTRGVGSAAACRPSLSVSARASHLHSPLARSIH